MTGVEPTRADLVRAARRGDLDAFAALVREERPTLIMAARTLTGDFHEAEDAAHDALVAAWTSLGRLRDPGSFGPWLSRILTRTALRRRRALARRHPAGDLDAVPASPAPADARLDRLLRAVDRLPRKYRELVSLYYLRDHSLRETAAALSIPEKLAKSRLHQARGLLTKEVDDERD